MDPLGSLHTGQPLYRPKAPPAHLMYDGRVRRGPALSLSTPVTSASLAAEVALTKSSTLKPRGTLRSNDTVDSIASKLHLPTQFVTLHETANLDVSIIMNIYLLSTIYQ